jgi:hypothetical protein
VRSVLSSVGARGRVHSPQQLRATVGQAAQKKCDRTDRASEPSLPPVRCWQRTSGVHLLVLVFIGPSFAGPIGLH